MKVLSGILRVLSWISYVVIIAALLIAAPILFGNRPVVILSGSMEPAYPVGSIIYYKPAEFSDIQAGDAITFKIGDDSLATHRVVSVNEGEKAFETKGDNNPSADAELVAYDRVVGKASSFAVPYAGYFAEFMRNWQIIAAVGVILLLDLIVGTRVDKQKKHTEQNGFALATEPSHRASNVYKPKNYAAGSSTNKRNGSSAISGKSKDISAKDFFNDL